MYSDLWQSGVAEPLRSAHRATGAVSALRCAHLRLWRCGLPAETYGRVLGAHIARFRRAGSLVQELGLVAVFLEPDTTVGRALLGEQHVKEGKGGVLALVL